MANRAERTGCFSDFVGKHWTNTYHDFSSTTKLCFLERSAKIGICMSTTSTPAVAQNYHGRPSQNPLYLLIAGVLALAVFILISERFSTSFTSTKRAQVSESIQLRFEDRSDGAVVVFDHTNNAIVSTFVGEASFVRTVLRTLASERIRRGLGGEQPFILSRHIDGRVTLIDPITERGIEMAAFGSTNAAQFAKLLPVIRP